MEVNISNINSSKLQCLETIERLFLCASNVNLFSWDEIRKYLQGDFQSCCAFQEEFIGRTVKHYLLARFPMKCSYQKHFVKRFMTLVESLGEEVSEIVYSSYVNLLQKSDDDSLTYYRHFKLGNEKLVSVCERKSYISDGTTGLQSWQGALALSEWLLLNNKELQNKTILELGSGCGLAGLILLQTGTPMNFYFSDCHSEVLKQLQLNLDLNLSKDFINCDGDFDSKSDLIFYSGKYKCCNVRILNLNWELIDGYDEIDSIKPDVIIASDVVYDDSLFESLCGTLKYFLGSGSAYSLLACTIRNEITFQSFCRILGSKNLNVKEIQCPHPKVIPFSLETPIKFIEVRNGGFQIETN